MYTLDELIAKLQEIRRALPGASRVAFVNDRPDGDGFEQLEIVDVRAWSLPIGVDGVALAPVPLKRVAAPKA